MPNYTLDDFKCLEKLDNGGHGTVIGLEKNGLGVSHFEIILISFRTVAVKLF